MGNYLPPPIPLKKQVFLKCSFYQNNPWEPLPVLPRNASILMIGSGLTMVDKVLELEELGHQGEIHVLSRHGLIPLENAQHLDCTSQSFERFSVDPSFFQAPCRLMPLFQMLRKKVKEAKENGYPPDCVYVSFMAQGMKLCRSFCKEDVSRARRHLQTYISIHTQRIPKESYRIIQTMIAQKQVHIHAGRLMEIEKKTENLRVEFRMRSSDVIKQLSVRFLVNCLGPAKHIPQINDPLLQQLQATGMIGSSDDSGIFHTSPFCCVIDREGKEVEGLFAIGPLKKKSFGSNAIVFFISKEVDQLTTKLFLEIT